MSAAGLRRVPVGVVGHPYDVVIGPGARHQLAGLVGPDVDQAVVVTQPVLAEVARELDPGVPFDVVLVPEGEAAKTPSEVTELCRGFARRGLARSDLVVALGGGVVSDLAGFAAAVYHRGVAYVNVATTLLAQVDAAIGGKTGVNLPEGKNLMGAFHQPVGVLCDTELLATLPPREWACGRGEMAKYAFLGGPGPDASILDLPLAEQVARCVAIKAAVVAADEREGSGRVVLNYGHTLGHALEAAAFDAGDLRHGEAVAIGLVFAALLARRLGRIDDERVALHRRVVGGFDLAAELPVDADPELLMAAMARDKKARHDLTFVLDGPQGVEAVRGVDAVDVLATLAEMSQLKAGA